MTEKEALKRFIKKRPYFFWYTAKKDMPKLPIEVVVEATLNYGNLKDIKKLFEIVGIRKISRIFFKQISWKRNNYKKEAINFYKKYFEKYA